MEGCIIDPPIGPPGRNPGSSFAAMTHDDVPRAGDAGDWIATAVVVLAYFTYILVVAFAPEALRSPVLAGGGISVGLVSGAAIAAFTIALAGVYTYRRNKRDAAAASPAGSEPTR
jgi:uncharacterized membrane protein (DUF485 family)